MVRLLLSVLLLTVVACNVQHAERVLESPQLIPQPKKIAWQKGQCVFPKTFNYQIPDWFDSSFFANSWWDFKLTSVSSEPPFLELIEIDSLGAKYLLSVQPEYIRLEGGKVGLLSGFQTLLQLMEPNFRKKIKQQDWRINCLEIKDEPVFEHRGMLLDCSRHFFSLETVKKYIDALAFYKLNVLHWHLTEDQGWRIEIKAFPELTNKGAWRTEQDGSKYGGFYTQEQIKELVAYAQARGVTIIPEIELPGHAVAALAAYPYLSCCGKSLEVESKWGVFKDIYCAGNDSVYDFLFKVLDEVIELFPSEYIHIGGDEAPKYRWEKCSKCQQRIKEEKLGSAAALQAYFIGRIASYLEGRGRKIIGWDEILEGGIGEHAVVQSWRGFDGGIEAVKHGNKAIMSPTSHCYFDYGLDAIDIKTIYNFNPVPTEISDEERQLILGAECNVWTEHIPDENKLAQQVFPRILAFSEVMWNHDLKDSFEFFYPKIDWHQNLMAHQFEFGWAAMPGKIRAKLEGNQLYMGAEKSLPDLQLKYKKKEQWINLLDWVKPDSSGLFEVRAFKKGKSYGDIISRAYKIHQGIGRNWHYAQPFSRAYPAGGITTLSDGLTGSLNFRDGVWQGFSSNELDVSFALDSLTVNTIDLNFYAYNPSWIFIPLEVELWTSSDNITWKKIVGLKAKNDPKNEEKFIESFHFDVNLTGGFLRIKTLSLKEIPDWHAAAGAQPWIFIDEIQLD